MNNKSSFFAMLSRMKYINRWGLMRNTINESIAAHTLDVIFIAHALVVVANTYFNKNLDEGRVALLAAFHDAPEIMTGDLPTPVKYFNPNIREAYGVVEDAAINKMLFSLPEEMRTRYEGAFNGADENDKILFKYVKAADKLSALIKCIEEERMGNSDFETARNSTLILIKDMNMPEVDFFIENFLPAYSKSLDELTDTSESANS